MSQDWEQCAFDEATHILVATDHPVWEVIGSVTPGESILVRSVLTGRTSLLLWEDTLVFSRVRG